MIFTQRLKKKPLSKFHSHFPLSILTSLFFVNKPCPSIPVFQFVPLRYNLYHNFDLVLIFCLFFILLVLMHKQLKCLEACPIILTSLFFTALLPFPNFQSYDYNFFAHPMGFLSLFQCNLKLLLHDKGALYWYRYSCMDMSYNNDHHNLSTLEVASV